MSGSQTVVAKTTLTASTTASSPVTTTIPDTLSTAILTTAVYIPADVEIDVTNTSTIEISGSATGIPGDLGIALQSSGTLSTVTNSGAIIGDTTITVPANGSTPAITYYGIGLAMQGGGKVVNEAKALISGAGDGVQLLLSTLVNYGTVEGHQGTLNVGVIAEGSTVTNVAGGTIESSFLGLNEVADTASSATIFSTVINAGLIEATGFGGYGVGAAVLGGDLTNEKGGTILGFSNNTGSNYGDGAIVSYNETLINYGLISLTGSVGIGVNALEGSVLNGVGGTIAGVKLGLATDTGTLLNAGVIAPPLARQAAVVITVGSGTNFSTGLIEADTVGLDLGVTLPSTFVNAGTIEAFSTSAGEGVYLEQGSFANLSSGTVTGEVSGYRGIVAGTAAIFIYNTGIVGGTGTAASGVEFSAGTLLNGGAIGGATAVAVVGTGTVSILDAGELVSVIGTTANTAGVALSDPDGAVDLTLDPGFSIVGSVVLDTAAGSSVLLASGASAGVLDGLGETVTGLETVSFATGAAWTVEGNTAGLAASQTIDGFTMGDTIVLDSIVATLDTYVSGTGLELTSGGSTITLDIKGNFTTSDFIVTDPPGSTTISLSCFVAGTRILTPDGEVPVEALRVGDQIVLHGGGTAPIRWIGRRRLVCARHPAPERILPVRIAAGALLPGVPKRDLLVSPDHALCLGGCLIPAKALLNGATIRQIRRRAVTYYHFELPAHAVLYAEGTPAESYLDTGNRDAFEGGPAMKLHPDFAQTLRERTGCAPFAEAGPVVEQIRRISLDRAGIATETDPALHILYRSGCAIIASRSGIPGLLTPDPRDRRRLGVKVARLAVGRREIPLDHPALADGWHAPEPEGRWTDGRGVIPPDLLRGSEELRIRVAATTLYPVGREGKDAVLAG